MHRTEIKAALLRAGCEINDNEMSALLKDTGLDPAQGMNFATFTRILSLFKEEPAKEVNENIHRRVSLRYRPSKSTKEIHVL